MTLRHEQGLSFCWASGIDASTLNGSDEDHPPTPVSRLFGFFVQNTDAVWKILFLIPAQEDPSQSTSTCIIYSVRSRFGDVSHQSCRVWGRESSNLGFLRWPARCPLAAWTPPVRRPILPGRQTQSSPFRPSEFSPDAGLRDPGLVFESLGLQSLRSSHCGVEGLGFRV